jgi:L-ectoine synthase
MITRNTNDIMGTERDIKDPKGQWVSRRLLLKKDGMGFSLHETTVYRGAEIYLWYKHHLEAVYCISGEGEVEDLQSGIAHAIRGGVMYALNKHEKHILRATTNLQMICVFNPPLTGNEVHTNEGYYTIDADS